MEDREEEETFHFHIMPKPAEWVAKVISFQADIIYNCLVSLFSPFISLFSSLFESYRRTEEATARVETVVQNVPKNITHGGTILLKKLKYGLLGAIHMCMVLLLVLVLAVVLGVGLVQVWVEEPVFVRERVFFDYSEVNPKAVYSFGGGGGGWLGGSYKRMKQLMGVPVGHTFHVCLVLLLPESDYNIEIGVFQLMAELLSTNGKVIAKSSQPCMLQFRSLPVRLARTFLMGIPLLLGLSSETQQITIKILQHKEGYLRTKAIRLTLIPRAGTSYVPQLYEAEIVMNSQLPWTKELVHNWKWTLYVWASIHMYIILVIILICCCKPLIFPTTAANISDRGERSSTNEEPKEARMTDRDEKEVSEFLRKWQRSRSKRKAILLLGGLPETVGSSASSSSVIREETSMVVEEDIGDSESVCLGG